MDNKDLIRILLVDDDKEDYELIKDIIMDIKEQKYSVDWALSYENALNEIEKGIYDLFLIDYNLGARSGLDLINELSENNKNIPIIMLTGYNNREVDLFAMKKGASDYLIKGKIDQDQIERSIRYAIEKKSRENQIKYLAYYDQVTDLPNRVFFKEQLNYSLAHATRYNRMMAVLYLDLDNFKLINDSFGHHIGDMLLKEVAKRLYASIRKSDIMARNNLKTLIDTVARQGGDEFTISLTEIGSFEDASIVAARIIKSVNEPYIIENHELFTGVSIGIALYPSDSNDAENLLKYADNAMYFAKKQGKNCFHYYQTSMTENVLEKINMINNLRKATEKDEFLLYYQPKMNIKSGKIIGLEALIRWNQSERGIVSPADFIPFAQENNLLSNITDWVINTVCMKLSEWERAKLKLIPISINLPINQFNKPDFTQHLMGIIETYHISSSLIELEVTESIFMDDMEITNSKLSELRSIGFQISIDDFGTGFSSLNRLKQIPCNILKIDKSFIMHMTESPADIIIVNSIITMGHGLNMEILAEGVETIEQFDILKKHNCDNIQGYILSRPLPEEKILNILIKETGKDGIGIELIKKISGEN